MSVSRACSACSAAKTKVTCVSRGGSGRDQLSKLTLYDSVTLSAQLVVVVGGEG